MQQRRDELAAKLAILAAREQELSELRGQLFSFEGRYIRQVGVLLRQLDEWEQQTADLHADKQNIAFKENSERDADFPSGLPLDPELPDLKVMFRELAKRIHPDFATDLMDEQRRTHLMAQANDALRRKDRQALQRMLHGFEAALPQNGFERVTAALAEIAGQIRQTELDIASAEADRETLAHSELAELQQQTLEAAKSGRDLLAEMGARVKGRIGMAMRQYELDLHRVKHPPKGPSVETLVTAETYRELPRTPRYDARRRTWMR